MPTVFRQPHPRKPHIDPNQFRLFAPTSVEKRVDAISKVKSPLEREIHKTVYECASSIYCSLMAVKSLISMSDKYYLPAKWETIRDNARPERISTRTIVVESLHARMPTHAAIMEILHFSKIIKEHEYESVRKEGRKIFATSKALLILESLELQIKEQNYERVGKTIDTLSRMRENSAGKRVYERIGIYANSAQEEVEGQKPN